MADKAIEPGKKSTERYLLEAAWKAMSKAERKKTDDKKKRESRKGKQFVKNTEKAKKARKMASKKAAKSKKHSDLYTDEDPKGTIKGLQFKNKRAAALSVAKIKRSDRSHAHKTQAAIAMEQRAKVAKKSEAAGVYRKFIEEQKRKTKAKNK